MLAEDRRLLARQCNMIFEENNGFACGMSIPGIQEKLSLVHFFSVMGHG